MERNKKKMREILISGYYGFKNSGDDALLKSITDNLKKEHPDYKIVVLSKNPEETEKNYGVKAIKRTNPFSVLFHGAKAKLLVSGGGTLIQDATSTKSLIYYLAIMWIAKLFGAKVMLYANGIGPVKQEENRMRTTKVLNRTDAITLRDERSYEETKNLGITKPEILVTADPVFLIDGADKNKGREILKKAGVLENKKILGISLREWKRADADFNKKITDAIETICRKTNLYPVFLPLQPKDFEICKKILNGLSIDSVVIEDNLSVEDVLAVVKNFNIAMGMRLHSLIYSASCAVPVVGISYDPKVSGFMEYAKQDKFVNAEDLDKEKLIADTLSIYESYDEIKNVLTKTADFMKEKAEKNCEVVARLLAEDKK